MVHPYLAAYLGVACGLYALMATVVMTEGTQHLLLTLLALCLLALLWGPLLVVALVGWAMLEVWERWFEL